MAVDNSGWGIVMDRITYNGKNMTGPEEFSKIGFIDSGNTSIQVPESVFENLVNAMREKDKSVGARKLPGDDGKTIIIANKPCDKLYETLGPLKFRLQGTTVVLAPRGYLYHLGGDFKKCFIGIQKIPNSANQYRLGTIFLRNFYTALDYDNNLILMGINKGASTRAKAYIDGTISNPASSGGMTIGIVIVIMLVGFGIAIICYFK